MTGIKDIYDMVGSLEHGFVVSRIKRVDKLLELGAFWRGSFLYYCQRIARSYRRAIRRHV